MYASTSLYTQSVTQTVKNVSAVQENWVHSLGQEDPLEKGTANHSSILTGEFQGQRSLACCRPWGRKESDTTEKITFLLFFTVIINVLISYCRNGSGIFVMVLCPRIYVVLLCLPIWTSSNDLTLGLFLIQVIDTLYKCSLNFLKME